MSFKDMIKTSVMNNFISDITIGRIAIVLAVSLVLGLYVFIVYRMAVNNEFYSKDFNRTLVLMAVVTAAIVLAVQSNLVISLGMVGALSIVRYRTAIKSSLDLFFLFWAISIGIICGAGLYVLAVALCLIVTLGLFITGKMASPVALGLLVINCDKAEVADQITETIKPLTRFLRMKNRTVSKDSVELILEYKADDDKALENAIGGIDGVNRFAFMNFDRETRI
ncbi:MAG: DUF4956 domain-containing protein [Lachnospiraceae bacterium]|nr:DUF4956 domain-containing protein [Lachnospiraceae bacterium]